MKIIFNRKYVFLLFPETTVHYFRLPVFVGFNLDRLQEVVNEADLPPGLVTLRHTPRVTNKNATPATSTAPSKTVAPPSKLPTREAGTLSSKEIERDRGKPLSKYERNVMIFDWLHTLDESATVDFN